MLIHGAQTPWQVWNPQIMHFSQQYFVVVPVLPGHDIEQPKPFLTVEQAVKDIEHAYTSAYGSDIKVLCGMSLGGAIASLLWTNSSVKIDTLILDGAPLVPQPAWLSKVLVKHYIALTHKTKQRDPKTIKMAKNNFVSSQHMTPFLELMDAMTEDTVRNFTASVGKYSIQSMDLPHKTKILYLYGTAPNELLSRKSARKLKQLYPSAQIQCLKGYGHGELTIFHPDEFIRVVEAFMHR